MKVFSKRYSSREYIRPRRMYGPSSNTIHRSGSHYRPEFLESSLRIRLSQEISYLISSGDYTEPFLLAQYKGDSKYFLHANALQRLSYHELGYDLTEYYSPEDLVPVRIETEDGNVYFDKFLIDLVELLIIFALENKREEITKRFQKILQEENSDLLIYGYMVVIRNEGGLQSITSLLSDITLKQKLDDILIKRVETTVAAGESADITQRVFSGKTKGQTKQDTEKIIEDIAKRWIDEKDHEEFTKTMNSLVKNIKNINNQIANIRHTDRATIEFGSPDIFKMIRNLNLAISEMAILSTQDDFIEKESVTELKERYISDYSIANAVHTLSKPQDSQINFDDIPF